MREERDQMNVIAKWATVITVAFIFTLLLTGRNCQASSNTYSVSVAKGYLALRTAKAYDSRNEIGELYSGDIVEVSDYSDCTYWYVYAPKYNMYGYVNKNYLYQASCPSYTYIPEYQPSSQPYTYYNDYSRNIYTVSVAKGYLALRTAKAYDDSNEIGELYTGDTVTVLDTSDCTYWSVYSPKYDRIGYVNKNYLY